jgi:pimeloyl-ACP methyl ester carboxylesterase
MNEASGAGRDRAEPVPGPGHGRPIAGEVVSTAFAYDGGRQVAVYVPPDPPQAVVFAGDGRLISGWGGSLEAAGVPPTLVVGAYRSDDPDEMVRLQEDSPSFDAARFAAHESFFVDDHRRWVRSQFGVTLTADRTAVCGVSASAEFALAMGVRHSELYGSVFASSPGGGYRPPPLLPGALPRTYLTAGTSEPFFLENAICWADALREAGADVVLTERAGDHGDPFWEAEFPLMVAWAFAS